MNSVPFRIRLNRKTIRPSRRPCSRPSGYRHKPAPLRAAAVVLQAPVLSGGGALGSYEAGVVAALVAAARLREGRRVRHGTALTDKNTVRAAYVESSASRALRRYHRSRGRTS